MKLIGQVKSGATLEAARDCRIIFALDATASREPTWDTAADTTARMFEQLKGRYGLQVKLAYFRGFREFKMSPWLGDASELQKLMTTIVCRSGRTQLDEVLVQTIREAKRGKVDALVLVGDAVEENTTRLHLHAEELATLGVPIITFCEGKDPQALGVFRTLAELSGGAWARFSPRSAEMFGDLLSAAVVFTVRNSVGLLEAPKEKRPFWKRLLLRAA